MSVLMLSPCLNLFLSLAYDHNQCAVHSNIHLISITLEAIVALHSLNRPNCHYFCSRWVKAVLNMSNLYLKIEYDRILMHRHLVILYSVYITTCIFSYSSC